MKLLACLIGGIVSISALASHASETAKATAFCYSLRFQRGLEPDGNYYLDLSSARGGNNGELALDFFNSGYTHSAYLSLEDQLFADTVLGMLAIDVPDGGDANEDGFPDFFQVSQGVTNLTSTGAYQLDNYGNGSTTATWNRNAGSKDGLCVLSIKLLPFQPVKFSLGFEIIEYKGAITYTPTLTNVSGSVLLTQTGNTNSLMSGPVEFVKSTSDRFNNLTFQAGSWTNESQQELNYVRHLFARDETWPTNYFGYLEFDDDTNSTTLFPYGVFMLSIDDVNDANHNGIPDFSDDPAGGQPARSPQLDLAQEGTNLVLTIHGNTGSIHDVQAASDLASLDWSLVVSVTLTNDPQRVVIPLPVGAASFWRVKTK